MLSRPDITILSTQAGNHCSPEFDSSWLMIELKPFTLGTSILLNFKPVIFPAPSLIMLFLGRGVAHGMNAHT